MGLGAFIGEGGTREHLEWERYMVEASRVERKRRIMWDRMVAVVEERCGKTGWPDGLHRKVIDRIIAGQDRVYPIPTMADCAHLPLPVWVDEHLICQGCGTPSSRKGHIEGFTTTQCSSCRPWPKLGSSVKRSV